MKKIFLSSSFSDVSHLLSQFLGSNPAGKTVTFIPTASKPESVKFYVKSAKVAFEKINVIVDILDITEVPYETIEAKLLKNDYIYVSGGNTFFLLQELKRKKVDSIIADLIDKGKPYIGESAGSIILAPNIEYIMGMDDSKKAPELENYDSMNLIDFFPVPHHSNFPFKKKVNAIISNYETKIDLHPFSNSQAILINGDEKDMVE